MPFHTLHDVNPSPLQALASHHLGTDAVEWVRARREDDDSYQAIARSLRLATDGHVDVTDETIRRWCTS